MSFRLNISVPLRAGLRHLQVGLLQKKGGPAGAPRGRSHRRRHRRQRAGQRGAYRRRAESDDCADGLLPEQDRPGQELFSQAGKQTSCW